MQDVMVYVSVSYHLMNVVSVVEITQHVQMSAVFLMEITQHVQMNVVLLMVETTVQMKQMKIHL